MRIALVNWSSRRAGGAEAYLAGVMPALAAAGHEVRLWREEETPADRPLITTQATFSLSETTSVHQLRDWKPDLIYGHGLKDPGLERRVIEIAPAIFFAHSYYGTCISGTKTWSFPTVRPCTRRFGPACLGHFYPHRCGGLNPATMLRDYALQSERLGLLPSYRAIVTNSTHMREEYLRHGFSSERVHKVTFPVTDTVPETVAVPQTSAALRLAFIGRMDRLKGGEFLLDALRQVRDTLKRPIAVTFAGDGPEREHWQSRGNALARADRMISVAFPGWLDRGALGQLLASTDLLVFPSVWPEPFGLTGPEAGLRSVPAAAFATGGVVEWLKDGVNGFSAPGDRPESAELANAITRCVQDPDTFKRLKEGALRIARQFTMEAHLRDLLPVFERVRT